MELILGLILLTLLALAGGGGFLYVYTLRSKQAHELSLANAEQPGGTLLQSFRALEAAKDSLEKRVTTLESNWLASQSKRRRA